MPDESQSESSVPDDLGPAYADLLSRTAAPDMPEPAVPPCPLRIIEAMLFVGGNPLTAASASAAIRGLTAEQFEQAIAELSHAYRRQNRPYAVVPHDRGFILALRPRYEAIAAKLQGGMREARLSVAAVDVLALVGYRQPIAKREIDSFRGLESGSLVRQLVRRGLVQIIPLGDAKKEVAYSTTPRFLELFGLQSLDDLPRTRDL